MISTRRVLFGFAVVSIGFLSGSLQHAAAQSAEEAVRASKTELHEPAPEEPALQLKLDDTGVEVAPPPPRTADGYMRAEMDRRIRNAKIGVVVSVFPILIGGVLAASALSGGVLQVPPPSSEEAARDDRLGIAAATLVSGGAASMLTTGILLGVRKRKLRRLEEAEYRRLRRVQWDPAQSRVVF